MSESRSAELKKGARAGRAEAVGTALGGVGVGRIVGHTMQANSSEFSASGQGASAVVSSVVSSIGSPAAPKPSSGHTTAQSTVGPCSVSFCLDWSSITFPEDVDRQVICPWFAPSDWIDRKRGKMGYTV